MKLSNSKLSVIFMLCTGLGMQEVHATNNIPLFNNLSSTISSSFVASLSGGPVWENGGRTQTFFLAPQIEKSYAKNETTDALAEGEFFVGIQKSLHENQFQSQIGLAVVTTGNAKLSGYIWDDADPQFNNYIYNYRLKHSHIALKGKILVDRGYVVIPWISGSVGVGFNEAYRFTNMPTIFEALPTPDFVSHTKTAFTYNLGAGVQKALTSNWQIGIGYEFADWGKSQLARAPGQTMGTGLTLDHLYTNGFLVNITYLA